MGPASATLRVEPGRTVLRATDGDDLLLQREPVARPFLKWTGGKQWLAAVAPDLVPGEFIGRYFEPFLGGGSMFFALGRSRASLSDANEELIQAYVGVRDAPEKVIDALRTYPYERNFFERLRRAAPRTPHTRAARLIYLNKTAFNGMYRVNLQGEFNVPFGRYANPTICNEERLLEASAALEGTKLRACDFEAGCVRARKGDVVYFDPPYITGHRNNGFLKYNAPLFSWQDQQRLARLALRLADRGVLVLVSNSDHFDVVALYSGFLKYTIERNSLIGGTGSTRGTAQEALLSSVPLRGVATRQL